MSWTPNASLLLPSKKLHANPCRNPESRWPPDSVEPPGAVRMAAMLPSSISIKGVPATITEICSKLFPPHDTRPSIVYYEDAEEILGCTRPAPFSLSGSGIVQSLYDECIPYLLQICCNEKCVRFKEILDQLAPPCTTWVGFREWALQLAACFCSSPPDRPLIGEPFGLWSIMCKIAYTIVHCNNLHAHKSSLADTGPRAWETSVCLPDIIELCSWLNSIFNARYEVLYPHAESEATIAEFDQQIFAALKRSVSLQLCPQRISSIALNLPGGELNLPALIPRAVRRIFTASKGLHSLPVKPPIPPGIHAIVLDLPCEDIHLLIDEAQAPPGEITWEMVREVISYIENKDAQWYGLSVEKNEITNGTQPPTAPGLGRMLIRNPKFSSKSIHHGCSVDICEESAKNFTSVKQLHLCSEYPTTEKDRRSCYPRCATMEFPQDLLIEATKKSVTAWSLDGKSIIREGQPFMAISHVWADRTGTGVQPPGTVNECLFNFFREAAEKVGCKGIWWDTISIPMDKEARCIAINNMHLNYEQAKVTLVHDRSLASFKWSDHDPGSACFAIIMSPWFSRGWTALELAKSKIVKVLFANKVIKDLDKDILAQVGKPSSPSHQLATTAILSLRGIGDRKVDIDTVLTSLGPRYTSWSRDRAIIAGLLVSIEHKADVTQQEIYRMILKEIGEITSAQLFHESTTMSDEDFAWCPTDLFRMTPSIGTAIRPSTQLVISNDGFLVGPWKVWCLSACKDSIEFPSSSVHALVRLNLRLALRETKKHLLITELEDFHPVKGMLVRLIKSQPQPCKNTGIATTSLPEITAIFIGFVHLHGARYSVEPSKMLVKIGKGTDPQELDQGDIACRYLSKAKADLKGTPSWENGGLNPWGHRACVCEGQDIGQRFFFG